MMPVKKAVSVRSVTAKDVVSAMNWEVMPVLREVRSVVNREYKVDAATGDLTVADEHRTVLANSASALSFTLPDAELFEGVSFTLKNVGAGLLTILSSNSQTIDADPGAGALTVAQWSWKTVQSDGSNWVVVG